ncbi:hypothetical protein [Membranihabitans maritimus]|uniref:SLOG domain-containing protein n=1 Tax=Membranihabitans maritimus TaxID=2904244 RepID=UPI001F2B295F|nr:hypothetical protein [Membranihabitans maritimus]
MAKAELKNIFLSASIPLPERDPKYFETADVIAIRDSVTALASTVLPQYRLIWGGHPSITPIINYVIQRRGLQVQDRVTIYQSKFFEHRFPPDNNEFKNVHLVESTGDRESSLLEMRRVMFSSHHFYAAIFIGGMEGVEREYELFREFHPKARILPIASTGAAAKLVYSVVNVKEKRFETDYAYSSLFKDFLLQ